MQIRHFLTLLATGATAFFLILPHVKAVTITHSTLILPSASNAPCGEVLSLPSKAAFSDIEKFAIKSYPYEFQMGQITGSCWLSSDAMIAWDSNKISIFDRATQRVTPIIGTETVVSGKHWVTIASLSPNGHWLVWAGGEDGHSTWEAVTTDGAEHRQWPRDEGIVTPAVAWMQDNTHWVELCDPETHVNERAWQRRPNSMRARVYSLATSDIQDFPLRLDKPDPNFNLPPNCGKTAEFIFTRDGHAWLSQNWQFCCLSDGKKPCSRDDVYELLPGSGVWTLHKSSVYPVADQERWMFDAPTRSPDGNWIVWRNYTPNGRDRGRLMLSRTDGSDMQEIGFAGDGVEWSPDSHQIAFNDGGPLGIVTLKLDTYFVKANRKAPCSSNQVAGRPKAMGMFPVAYSQTSLAKSL